MSHVNFHQQPHFFFNKYIVLRLFWTLFVWHFKTIQKSFEITPQLLCFSVYLPDLCHFANNGN